MNTPGAAAPAKESLRLVQRSVRLAVTASKAARTAYQAANTDACGHASSLANCLLERQQQPGAALGVLKQLPRYQDAVLRKLELRVQLLLATFQADVLQLSEAVASLGEARDSVTAAIDLHGLEPGHNVFPALAAAKVVEMLDAVVLAFSQDAATKSKVVCGFQDAEQVAKQSRGQDLTPTLTVYLTILKQCPGTEDEAALNLQLLTNQLDAC